MDNTLKLFSEVTAYLISFTGYNEYLTPKSRGIETYSDLADELNQEGILTARGNRWTANSLECFFSRCRKKYSNEQLKDCCPYELIGARQHEYLASELMPKRPRAIRFRRSLH